MRQSELEIRPNYLEWCHEGMELFAFSRTGSLKFKFIIIMQCEENNHFSSGVCCSNRTTSLALSGYYWDKRVITWTVKNGTPSISRRKVDQTVAAAFAMWADAAKTLTFTHVSSSQVSA